MLDAQRYPIESTKEEAGFQIASALEMPRKLVTLQSEFPYHVTARCINKHWFDLPIDDVWLIMEDYLFLCQKIYCLQIHSFVLMPNHFHLIVSTPEANISKAMQFFMGNTSREITRLSGRINQTYGSRHHKCLITNWHYFLNVYKYVYRNPVKAGLCKRTDEYEFSTLFNLFGNRSTSIPIVEDTVLFDDPNQTMKWLNTKPLSRHEVEIKNALRRPVFSLAKSRITHKASELETLLM
jgi:putative transposase